VVEDPWNPSQVRFLHVEQEAEVGGSMARALRLQSAGGIPFDGVRIGAWAVFFRRGGESGEVATVLEVPAGVEQVLITGLAAKGSYPVREERSATGGWRIWIAGGGGALGLANDSGALSWHLPESI
jgi:hypothetical protein